MTKGC